MALSLQYKPGIWKKRRGFVRELHSNYHLYLLGLPAVVLTIIFSILPMFGVLIAFKDYHPYVGVARSPWVGWTQFSFLSNPEFWNNFKNTAVISMMKFLVGFPAPIVLALLLNEVRHQRYKNFVQNASYLPHFVSWVIMWGVVQAMLSYDSGVVNFVLEKIGLSRILFLSTPSWFYPLCVGTDILKEVGWAAIIYLAAISGVETEQYESSCLDGAGRWQQVWYITLPAIMPVISILLILRLPGLLSAGLDQLLLMQNPSNLHLSDVLDTYILRKGFLYGQYSLAAAMGLFNSILGMILVIMANTVSKRTGGSGLY